MKKHLLFSALLLAVACGAPEETATDVDTIAPDAKLAVYTVSYPLEYFAERIGGEHVDAELPLPAGVDPAGFVPSMDQLSAYQNADVILLNGASYASWIDTVSLPTSRLVDTSAGFADRYIVIEDAVTHSHGPEGEHSHVETVATTWLDPTLAIEQAKTVRDALAAARPEQEAAFDEGLNALTRDLEALDGRLRSAFEGAPPMIASQSAYAYVARRYEVELPSLRFEAGMAAEGDAWHDLEHLLEDRAASVFLSPFEPSAEVSERITRMGLDTVVFDTCAGRPSSGDYLTCIDASLAALGAVN